MARRPTSTGDAQAFFHTNREPTRVQRSVVVPAVTSFPSCAKAHPPLSAGGDEVVGLVVVAGVVELLERLDVTADVVADKVGRDDDDAVLVVDGVSSPVVTITSRIR
jgi:precorrin-2 methylase